MQADTRKLELVMAFHAAGTGMFRPRSVASRKAESRRKPVRPQTAASEKRETIVADFRSPEAEPSTAGGSTLSNQEVVKALTTEHKAGLDPEAEEEAGSESESEEDDDPVIPYSQQQRWPKPGEPVCVVCGRYGAYIVDQTDKDVCSLECKAKHLRTVVPVSASEEYGSLSGSHSFEGEGGARKEGGGGEFSKGPWSYVEHQDVVGLTEAQVESLRREVRAR